PISPHAEGAGDPERKFERGRIAPGLKRDDRLPRHPAGLRQRLLGHRAMLGTQPAQPVADRSGARRGRRARSACSGGLHVTCTLHRRRTVSTPPATAWNPGPAPPSCPSPFPEDRKSTRLNSSHVKNSYAVFCLNKKKISMDT